MDSTQTTPSSTKLTVEIKFDSIIHIIKEYLKSSEIRKIVGDLIDLKKYCIDQKLKPYKDMVDETHSVESKLETSILKYIKCPLQSSTNNNEVAKFFKMIEIICYDTPTMRDMYAILMTEKVGLYFLDNFFLTLIEVSDEVVTKVFKTYNEFKPYTTKENLEYSNLVNKERFFCIWKYLVDNGKVILTSDKLPFLFTSTVLCAKALVYLTKYYMETGDDFYPVILEYVQGSIYKSSCSSHYTTMCSLYKNKEDILIDFAKTFYDINRIDSSHTSLAYSAQGNKCGRLIKYLIDNGIKIDLEIDHRCANSGNGKTEVNNRIVMLLRYYETQNDTESISKLIKML
jgi:hypothetical protein